MSDMDERLRLDYDQTTDLVRALTDVRFKLLALVPTISGVAVAVVGRSGSAGQLLAVGALGLVATTGVLLYEIRNTQVYEYALRRAKDLEARLGLVSRAGTPGGPFTERPGRTARVFGIAIAGHDRGLALVYGAALAGWAYLVGWGGLRALDVGNAKQAGAAIGIALGLVVIAELMRIDVRADEAGAAAHAAPGTGGP
jgi:hypothetical protein